MFNADARGIHAGMLGPVGTARGRRRRLRRHRSLPVRIRLRARDMVRRGYAGGRCRRRAVERRVGPPGLAGRVPAARAGRVARQLGRARPGRHRAATTTRSTSSSWPRGSRSRCSPRCRNAADRRTESACSASSASGHAGFALGVGARALDELLAIVPTKQRMGQFSPVADEQLFQHDFAMHDAALRAARAYVFDVFGACGGERRSPTARRRSCNSNGCARRPPTRRA